MNRHGLTLTSLLILLFCGSAYGQDRPGIETDYEAKANNWRFVVSPYAVLASQATDVAGERLRQSFTDLASMTNFGFQLSTMVRYKKWFLLADGTYANLESKNPGELFAVDLDIRQLILDLRLGHPVYTNIDSAEEAGVIRGWTLELNAGAKHWRNDIALTYRVQLDQPPPLLEDSLDKAQAWWDPMLGANARFILSRTVLLNVYASAGGLDIANASKFAYDFLFTNTFKVSRIVSVTAGYRLFGYDRIDGEGAEEVKVDVSVAGPVIGVSFAI